MLLRSILSAALVLVGASAWAGGINIIPTATPAPTATAAPTATVQPSPTAQPSPTSIASLPLSLANGGFGTDMSTVFLKQTKNMGTAGANGGFAATAVVRVALGTTEAAAAIFEYALLTMDGSGRWVVQAGHVPFVCGRETGGTTAGALPGAPTGTQVVAGVLTTGASLSGGVALSRTNNAASCDLNVALTVTVGTATSNTLYWNLWPLSPGGTWTAQ